MRKPAQIESWLTPEELLSWLKEAPTVEAYQKRLAVWLTYIGPFHAQEVAKMLGVSKQAVWLWLGQYNKHGPDALGRKGRGGRRWSLISWEEEEALLNSLEIVESQVAGARAGRRWVRPECRGVELGEGRRSSFSKGVVAR